MKNGKKFAKTTKRIGRKVGNLAVWMQGLSIIAVVAICIAMSYRLTINLLQQQCVNATKMLSYELENDSGPEDKTQLLDDLKMQLGCEFTIFHGNERAYTTVQQDGVRAVGTKLSDDISTIVLDQGNNYVGRADILGTPHLCSYMPTVDSNGQVNGLIFAGISAIEALKQIDLAILLSAAAGTVLIILGIILVSFYLKRAVSWPLSNLTALAQYMEQGNLSAGISKNLTADIHSNDEIGYLAKIFDNTIHRLKDYIEEISNILAAIAEGNLTVQPTHHYIGDFSAIRASLDNILQKLNTTLYQITESSNLVTSGSEQVSDGAQILSQGALEQANAVDELQETVRDISLQISQTAENAKQASLTMNNVDTHVLESNQHMQEMIHAMEEINNSSKEIEKIIKTIESIASQTNILALNAAVEAARAGENGKGFAVVAEEVRSLAGMSSEASQSTAELIEHSIRAVEQGTRIAAQTAEQLSSVVSGTNEVMESISQIADASRIQADSVSQIQNRVIQISEVVQTNSATAEQSAATSQQLSAQAILLKKLMDMFHLTKKP